MRHCKDCPAYETHDKSEGQCRLNAPTVQILDMNRDEEFRAIWPLVYASEWCIAGQQLKEVP